jgi:hypothetical protein
MRGSISVFAASGLLRIANAAFQNSVETARQQQNFRNDANGGISNKN